MHSFYLQLSARVQNLKPNMAMCELSCKMIYLAQIDVGDVSMETLSIERVTCSMVGWSGSWLVLREEDIHSHVDDLFRTIKSMDPIRI